MSVSTSLMSFLQNCLAIKQSDPQPVIPWSSQTRGIIFSHLLANEEGVISQTAEKPALWMQTQTEGILSSWVPSLLQRNKLIFTMQTDHFHDKGQALCHEGTKEKSLC